MNNTSLLTLKEMSVLYELLKPQADINIYQELLGSKSVLTLISVIFNKQSLFLLIFLWSTEDPLNKLILN